MLLEEQSGKGICGTRMKLVSTSFTFFMRRLKQDKLQAAGTSFADAQI